MVELSSTATNPLVDIDPNSPEARTLPISRPLTASKLVTSGADPPAQCSASWFLAPVSSRRFNHLDAQVFANLDVPMVSESFFSLGDDPGAKRTSPS